MARPGAIVAALKAVPGGARYTPAPQSSGQGRISPVQSEMYFQNSYQNTYGPFLPRPSSVFTDGAFSPMSPIQPVPVDQPPPGGEYADPRLWQYRPGWNLPTPPGTEGLKLACYTTDTEILTRRGWMAFPELADDDEVATRNPLTKEFEWQKPAARHNFRYDGELVHFKSRGIDLLVTPNHRVLHTSGHGKNCSELIKRADECEILRSGAMVAVSTWNQPDLEQWDVPVHENHGYFHADIAALRTIRDDLGWTREQLADKAGVTARSILNAELGTGRFHVATLPRIKAICAALNAPFGKIVKPDVLSKISGDDFAAFMGAYLSEGCVSSSSSGNLRIFISQKPYSKGYDEFRDLLIRMLGREPYYDGSSWTFSHDGLAIFLRQFGHSASGERIPDEVLNLSARQLQIFWDFYVLGDGWIGKTGQAITTTSEILAGQLQEVAQKIGLSATVYRREVKPRGVIRGRLIKSAHARYDIFLRTTKNPKWTSVERVEYEGLVHCVSVPNGIVYVRRNGKAIWSGNSFDQLRTLASKYCLSKETRILCSDFNWRPLAEITVGDEIIAFDENPPIPGQHRKMRIATVTECDRIVRPSYRIRFTDGREVVASAEHLWFSGGNGGRVSRSFLPRDCEVCGRSFEKGHAYGAHRKRAHGIDGGRSDNMAWIATDQLRPGSKIKDIGQPWKRDNSWESGYLSGVFDGEASLTIHSGPKKCWEITFPQKPGAVWDATQRFLKEKGYNTRSHGPAQDGCMHLAISGISDCFRFMGEMQPYRLLENSARWIDGISPSRADCAVVESVEFLGDQEVVAIGTSAKTLIAEGLLSHNSVARAAIDLRQQEIRGLRWDITLTTDAAKAYQGDRASMRDFGERKAKVKKFFSRPDPDFWNFDSFLNAMLEEIFVYDALSIIFRPKYGASFGMGGRGLLGSDLDSLNLISGPTLRPLVGMHGEHPRPPAPAYQQFLYGVPRSDYMTIATGADIDAAGLAGSEVNEFTSDVMLYAPYWPIRESPYGFPPVERALLPIISGLQKQEFQLDYFQEGTVPAVYISPGDPNITPTQIGELQNALNALAGDPAYHLKVVVLPPGSKVDPQRPVDLSDSFDYLVMNQVCMAFDVQPQELGIIPDIGGTPTGPSASGVRFSGQESRDIKSRKSTLPMLQWICDIFNFVIQDICQQPDMQFQFEGLVDDEDKQAITELGVNQVQNGIASIDEVRERLDLPPWGLTETSEPVVFTAQGPVPFSMAPQLILAAAQGGAGGQGTNGGQKTSSSRTRTRQPAVRAGGQTRPNGSHPAPLSPHREGAGSTPGHASAAGAIQTPTPRTGGTTGRSSVAGSRKKAAASELDALKRHIRKGREISSWEPVHITDRILGMVAEDIAKGVLLDTAIERALDIGIMIKDDDTEPGDAVAALASVSGMDPWLSKEDSARQFPGWQQDLGLVGAYKERIGQAFLDAGVKGGQLRKDAASGKMWVSAGTLHGLISDATRETFLDVMTPMWEKAWDLGYDSGTELLGKSGGSNDEQLQAFLGTEGSHWLDQVSRTGLSNPGARSEVIARTEVARAMNAGAMQAYKDSGVSYKHLLVSPDDTCDICFAAKEEGVIPLDAIFPGGGQGGPFHPQCRCIPAPAGIDVEPPQAHIGKSATEDESRLGWLLIRARDEDGKWRYLLQQRDDGSWGMPGGSAHVDEDGFSAACRETAEEVGDLPPLRVIRDFNHTDPDGRQVFLYLCEASGMFTPKINGSTPEETAGTGWFKRKEIGDLNLTPKFRDDWEKEVQLKERLAEKALRNRTNENGEWLVSEDNMAAGGGARWPYPHRADGSEWPDAGPGAVPGPSAGGEPPHWDGMSPEPGTTSAPEGGDDAAYPRRRTRNRPASRFPSQEQDPAGGIGTGTPPATSVGAPKSAPHPVVGSVPAKTPRPLSPHSEPPETFDPADMVEHWDPAQESDVVASKSAESDADLANPSKPGGPSDYHDPSPVDAEHILSIMRSNFPEKALEWVKNSRWMGPVEIPWSRINDAGIETWASSHQPDKVNEFAREIKAGRSGLNPSILIQKPGSDKCDIIDGHHRALAHRKLGQPVLSYVGVVRAGADTQAALEAHSSQLNSGSSPANK